MSPDANESFSRMENNPAAASAAEAAHTLDAEAGAGADRYGAARNRLREHWAEAKADLDTFRQRAVDYSQNAAKATNAYAHDHPWQTAGAAIGVGALLGWLITRRPH